MNNRVVITGAGLVSPLGDSPAGLNQALCLGQSCLAPLEDFSFNGSGIPLGGALKDFNPADYLGKANFRPLNRAAQLLAAAAGLCLDDSECTPQDREQLEVGLVVGTMFCSLQTIAQFDRRGLEAGPAYVSPLDFANTVINAASGQVAIWHKLRGINSTIAEGASSGLQALGYAVDAIRLGKTSMVLAGGVEELCMESLFGFYRRGLLAVVNGDGRPRPLPFDAGRDGFAPSEGAALFMLQSESSARKRGAVILAEIAGHANAFDVSLGREPESFGCSIAHAMNLALQEAGLEPEDVDVVSASANGSRIGDEAEARALQSLFGVGTPQVPVVAAKALMGEALGASGALQVVDLLGSRVNGSVPGTPVQDPDPGLPVLNLLPAAREMAWEHALVNSIGADGNCCSLVLRRG